MLSQKRLHFLISNYRITQTREGNIFTLVALLFQSRIIILWGAIALDTSINSSIHEGNSIAARRKCIAHQILKSHYVVIHRWTLRSPAVRFVRYVTHKQCLLPLRNIAATPSAARATKSISIPSSAYRTPVVTASRQARDNEIQCISTTSTCKDTEQQRQHTPRSKHTFVEKKKKKYIYYNNGRARNIIGNTLGPAISMFAIIK